MSFRTHGTSALANEAAINLIDARLTIIQRSALFLHNDNCNPIPLGAVGDARKQPRALFPHKKTGLLDRYPLRLGNHHEGITLLMDCFAGACNVAVACGDVSENLAAIDCETPEIGQYFIAEMTKRGLPVFAQTTGRGIHILFKVIEKSVKPLKVINATDDSELLYEVRTTGQYVVFAPSIHPSGKRYQFLDEHGNTSDIPFLDAIPHISIEQLDFLIDGNGNPIQLELDNGYKKYSDQTFKYLTSGYKNGQGQGHYGGRYLDLLNASSDFNWRGYSQSQAWSVLAPIARKAGLPEPEIRKAITGGYKTAQYRKPNTAEPNTESRWYRATQWANSHNWQGSTRHTDRQAFDVCVQRCKDDGFNNADGSFHLSARLCAELGHMHKNTANDALNRLCDYEFIECVGKTKQGARLFKFTDTVLKCVTTSTVVTTSLWYFHTVLTMTQLDTDLSESSALGNVGVRILRTLQAHYRETGKPMGASAIAKAVGCGRKTVYRHLEGTGKKNTPDWQPSLLSQSPLLERVGSGWIAHEDKQAEMQLSADFGVHGKGNERKEQHILERALSVIRAVHKAIVSRDKTHPRHDTTVVKKTPYELARLNRQRALERAKTAHIEPSISDDVQAFLNEQHAYDEPIPSDDVSYQDYLSEVYNEADDYYSDSIEGAS